MATIKFLIQRETSPAAIYARMSLSKTKSFKRKTGLFVNPKVWDKTKGLVQNSKDESVKSINPELRRLEGQILQQLNIDNAKGVDINAVWLENTIESFFGRTKPTDLELLIPYGESFVENLPYRSASSNCKSVSFRTTGKYKTIVDKLRAFQAYQQSIFQLKDVNIRFRDDFLRYLTEVENLSDNTAGRYIKFVKTIVLDARKHGLTISPQINDVKGFAIEPPKVTLSFEEISTLKQMVFLNERDMAVRDWLLISCFVGQRVGDLMRMNEKMIKVVETFRFIVITQEKTGKLVQIPIHPEVEEILQRRNGKFPPIFASDPASNNALYNRYLKEVCKRAGINELTYGNIVDPVSGVYGKGEYPKWMLVTSHIGRRSFATNFYSLPEYPTPLLMNITGQSTEVMFLCYIGKKPIDYGLQLAKIWSKTLAHKNTA